LAFQRIKQIAKQQQSLKAERRTVHSSRQRESRLGEVLKTTAGALVYMNIYTLQKGRGNLRWYLGVAFGG
jgi:hypothetical protein